jgi:hypothetical protein
MHHRLIVPMIVVLVCSGATAVAEPKHLPFLSLLLSDRQGAEAAVKEGVELVNEDNVDEIVDISFDASDNTRLQVGGELATSLQNDSILYVAGGADSRFPLGFAGRVVSAPTSPYSWH